jgi:dephospho-CoA kinase
VLKVGLTGGIACGKSAVGAMLAARGAHVIQADQIAHELMMPGSQVYDQVVRRFGAGIVDPDGRINRQKLAEVVFSPSQNPGESGRSPLQELNAIVHPAVVARQDAWAEQVRAQDPDGVAVIEAALILEAGAASHFDKLIVVVCDPELKAERLARRLGLDRESARREVERRSAVQWPDAEKQRAADFVIYNSGSLAETEAQVDRLFAQLKQLAKARR